jgi:Mor family transcriptional regulator
MPFDAIMDEYGFDAVCLFADMFGGATVYIPNKRTIFKQCLEQEAAKDFLNGATYRTLIQKYGLSERQLRRMLV